MIKKLILVFVSSIAIGCSTVVTEYIERSNSFDFKEIVSFDNIETYGLKNNRYCSTEHKVCTNYLLGEPLENKKLRYTVSLESFSGAESTVSLDILKSSLPELHSGTVVHIHGFRASKEFMLNSALYFRMLGFRVIVPDLLGHGESDEDKEYGVGDSKIVNEIINKYENKTLYIVGNSMGGTTAMHISTLRNDIDGIILQAPMLRFDKAALNYTKANFPSMTMLFSEESIKQGALDSLVRADITLEQTDIKPIIGSSSVPIIIFASSSDPIAPHRSYSNLASNGVSIVKVDDRNHPSMSIIGDNESRELIHWFGKLTHKSK
ncbi:alpha/beta fold hydrolase [Microbulbifer sp. MKSA007]|nr:alpha/beta fold hydrolase [Microbulbifer sp. MKSA007]